MTRDNVVHVVAIIAGVVIASIPGIWFLANDIANVRADAMAQISLLSAKQAGYDERFAAMEKIEVSHYTDDVAFRTEMRTAVSAVITALADVRVAVGAQHNAPK